MHTVNILRIEAITVEVLAIRSVLLIYGENLTVLC
jgi:hypothetical protein